jgi:hypothetical protein
MASSKEAVPFLRVEEEGMRMTRTKLATVRLRRRKAVLDRHIGRSRRRIKALTRRLRRESMTLTRRIANRRKLV